MKLKTGSQRKFAKSKAGSFTMYKINKIDKPRAKLIKRKEKGKKKKKMKGQKLLTAEMKEDTGPMDIKRKIKNTINNSMYKTLTI